MNDSIQYPVYILRTSRGRAPRHYHTDRDCQNIPTNPREIGPELLARMDLDECSKCAGDVEQATGGSSDPMKYIRKIKAQRDD